MEPITSNINDLRFTFNGKVYGLHHSKADLIPGKDKILPTGALTSKQTTAGDSTKGYSYFWDASDISSVKTSVHNQAHARNIYLVEAASANDVLPDINIPNTNARAIKGEMSILDKVSLPTNIGSGRDARIQVLEMLKRHGIIPETSARSDLINSSYFMARGERALEEYLPARFAAEAEKMIEGFSFNDPEKLPAAYGSGGYLNYKYKTYLDGGAEGLADMIRGERGEGILNPGVASTFEDARKLGVLQGPNSIMSPSEINTSTAKKYADSIKTSARSELTLDYLPDDPKQVIKARIAASRSRVAAQEATGKGFKKAIGSSSLVQAAQDAAQAVVNRDSAAMKVAGAAATIFRRRI